MEPLTGKDKVNDEIIEKYIKEQMDYTGDIIQLIASLRLEPKEAFEAIQAIDLIRSKNLECRDMGYPDNKKFFNLKKLRKKYGKSKYPMHVVRDD